MDNSNTNRSSHRENLIEHLLVGELMRRLWLRGITHFEVLKPQVDDGGYDIVLEANGVTRHVQLKSSFDAASTSKVKASLKLQSKPSACVVWVLFNATTLELGPYLWFGGKPGQAIPSLEGMRVAKHTRGDSTGVKRERPNQRMIPKSHFARLETLDELIEHLFGVAPLPARPILDSAFELSHS